MIRTVFGVFVVTTALAGCVRRSPAGAAANTENLQVVRRTWAAPDTFLAARGKGKMAVVVRSADLPMQSLMQARVQLQVGDAPQVAASRSADSLGLAAFDTLAVGRYRVTVSRIGYARAVVFVPVEPGCRTDLEIYIGMLAVGIDPPPPTPMRAVATLCPTQPDAAR